MFLHLSYSLLFSLNVSKSLSFSLNFSKFLLFFLKFSKFLLFSLILSYSPLFSLFCLILSYPPLFSHILSLCLSFILSYSLLFSLSVPYLPLWVTIGICLLCHHMEWPCYQTRHLDQTRNQPNKSMEWVKSVDSSQP